MPGRVIVIDCPLPGKACHPNARAHHHAKAKAVKVARLISGLLARAQVNHLRWVPMTRARIELTYHVASKHDKDNLIAWSKGTCDGLQDAKIITNDSGFTYAEPVQIIDPKRTGVRKLLVRVVELE